MQIILNQLKGSIAYFLSQKSIADNLVQQRASLPNITFGPSGKLYNRSHMLYMERHLTIFRFLQASKTIWN